MLVKNYLWLTLASCDGYFQSPTVASEHFRNSPEVIDKYWTYMCCTLQYVAGIDIKSFMCTYFSDSLSYFVRYFINI